MKKTLALLMAGTILTSGVFTGIKASADELDKSKLNPSRAGLGSVIGDDVTIADIQTDEVSKDESNDYTKCILNLKGISESERNQLLNTEKKIKEENEKLDKIYDQIDAIYNNILKGVDVNDTAKIEQKEAEAEKATVDLNKQAEEIEKKIGDIEDGNSSIWEKVVETETSTYKK